jgi:hypothetical protein
MKKQYYIIDTDTCSESMGEYPCRGPYPTQKAAERRGYGAGTSRAGLRITNQAERLVPVAITPLLAIFDYV